MELGDPYSDVGPLVALAERGVADATAEAGKVVVEIQGLYDHGLPLTCRPKHR